MIGLFVFFNPFSHVTALKEMTYYGSLSVALYLFVSGKKQFFWSSPLTLPLLILFVWSSVGVFFALDRANSLHDVLYHLLKYVALFFLLITFYPSRRDLKALSVIVIVSATSFSIAAMVDFYLFQGHGIEFRLDYRLAYSGRRHFFEISANYLGFITVFASVLSLNLFFNENRGTRRAMLALCLIATITATLLTQTRGAIGALVLAFLLFGIKTRRGRLFVMFLPIIVAAFILSTDVTRERFSVKHLRSDERIGITLMYFKIIAEHPFAGIGFGMELLQKKEFMTPYYERVPEAYRDPFFNMSPHNFYLDVAVRLGCIGLLLYLHIIVTALRMVWQSFNNAAEAGARNDALCLAASFGAFLVQAFFADASFGAPAVVFYLHLAMITILWRESRGPAPVKGQT